MECSDQQSSVKSQQNARVNSTFHHGDNGHQREKASVSSTCAKYNFSFATQAWCPQSVKLIEDVEKVQRRATKYILNLGFITDISYKTRLLQLDILPVSYWHEYLDLVFLYKIINNLTYIDERALPIMAGSGTTRSESNANPIRFVIPYAKTVTYQTSFFTRTCKTWNILNSNLRTRDIGLLSFKSGHLNSTTNTHYPKHSNVTIRAPGNQCV